jgi:hypothetical protein
VNADDIISERRTAKTKLLSKAIAKRSTFATLDRRVRLELVSMDGATISITKETFSLPALL